MRCSTSLGFVLQTLWPEVRGCDIYLGEIEDMSYTFMEVAESIIITPPLQRKKDGWIENCSIGSVYSMGYSLTPSFLLLQHQPGGL